MWVPYKVKGPNTNFVLKAIKKPLNLSPTVDVQAVRTGSVWVAC